MFDTLRSPNEMKIIIRKRLLDLVVAPETHEERKTVFARYISLHLIRRLAKQGHERRRARGGSASRQSAAGYMQL